MIEMVYRGTSKDGKGKERTGLPKNIPCRPAERGVLRINNMKPDPLSPPTNHEYHRG